jgi:hypothetical protein
VIDPIDIPEPIGNWVNIGDVAEMAIWNIANRAKDRHDEKLDAKRVHNGMALDEFLGRQ